MPIGDDVTKDYQYSFNGMVFGSGTSWVVEELEGLDLPEVDAGDEDDPNDHGGFGGKMLLKPRVITLGLKVYSEAHASQARQTIESQRQKAIEALTPDGAYRPFVWQRPHVGKRMVWARAYKAASPYRVSAAWGFCDLIVELRAMDPRIYEVTERQLMMAPFVLKTGRTYNKTYNYIYESPATLLDPEGTVVKNLGRFETRPIIRINGPFTGATINNQTTGKRLVLKSGISPGEYVEIDMGRKSVRLNNTEDRRYFIDDQLSDWWSLIPGNNEIGFIVTSGTSASTAQIRWRSAWIV